MDNDNMNDTQQPKNSRTKEIVYKITGWNYLKETDKCARPVNWLKFYIYIMMPFGIIYGAFNTILKWGYTEITFEIIKIITIIFEIFVYIYLRRLTKTGYYLNIIYLIVTAVFTSVMYIQAMFVMSGTYYSSFFGIAILLILWEVVYFVLNLVYFKKRRELFIKDGKKQV
ncbi:MAG: hypothetical protein GYA50_09505 [Eubacteriaceae bacterium]|nr:hypothetical protein [Eubacteriaceae bacterium]